MKTNMAGVALLLLFAIVADGRSEMLEKGTVAPLFELATAEGKVVKLEEYRDAKYVVLVFYPGDMTPGCTKQLCEIRDDYSGFEQCDAVVFGVNGGSEESHTKFSEKYGFQFPLLLDKQNAIAELYGARGAIMNKRTVYVIDKSGEVLFARRGKPTPKEILAAVPCGKTVPDSGGTVEMLEKGKKIIPGSNDKKNDEF